ncbi:MAG: hypothetical protein JST40_04270 [Armatimonadetes bacterium]|nr:hypothetical protein [Armatimonadota bacterium]
MKSILKLVSVAALAAMVIGSSFAQTPPGPRGGGKGPANGQQGGQRMRGGGMMKMQQEIFAKLNLTADQKKKIEALNKKTGDAMRALENKKPEERRTAMQKIREDHQNALMKILTPKQQQEYKKLMKEQMEKFRKEHPGGPGGPNGGAPNKGAGGNKGGKKPA